MRTQKEILDMIQNIKRSKSDPMGVQTNILVHKLSWENAKPFINPKYFTDEKEKSIWQKTCRLDREMLEQHIEDHMDISCSDCFDNDTMKSLVNIQVFIILIWLFGKEKEHFLSHIINSFAIPRADCGEAVLKIICEEFNISWKLMQLRYTPKPKGIILPEKGDQNGTN